MQHHACIQCSRQPASSGDSVDTKRRMPILKSRTISLCGQRGVDEISIDENLEGFMQPVIHPIETHSPSRLLVFFLAHRKILPRLFACSHKCFGASQLGSSVIRFSDFPILVISYRLILEAVLLFQELRPSMHPGGAPGGGFLIAVHVGAGQHSREKEPLYRSTMARASRAASACLRTLDNEGKGLKGGGDTAASAGGALQPDALGAVTQAIQELEV